MVTTKEEWQAWRSHPLTKAFFEEISELASECAAQVLNREAPDIAKDQFLKGYVRGISEFAGWQPQIEQEEDDGDRTDSQPGY